jgi:hypothetical protein
VRHWVIPLSPIRRTYADRLVAVGDAAGQVKPTSGGGIYYGMLCAEVAAEVLAEGLRRDDLSARFLSRYERAWRGRIGAEIRAGRLFRRIFERMTGEEIDAVFRVLASDGILEEVAAEVQLEVVRGFSTEQNPQVIQLKTQIEEMKRQFARMQYGQGMELPTFSKNPGEPHPEIVVPFARVPRVGLDLARLTREAKVQQTVFELLTQQYEQAKIAEARDSPIVQVLDRAVPAEWKSKPKTTFNMALAGALSLFAGIFLAFFLEYWARITRERADAARPAVS